MTVTDLESVLEDDLANALVTAREIARIVKITVLIRGSVHVTVPTAVGQTLGTHTLILGLVDHGMTGMTVGDDHTDPIVHRLLSKHILPQRVPKICHQM